MTAENDSFLDVVAGDGWFTIPRLKWRELVFIRAVRRDGDDWVRDPDRFMPPFAAGDLLPVGQRFCVTDEGERVRIASSTGES